MPLTRYNWKALNKQQVGTFTEYFVKMEFTMYGFQVYGTEIDDRGIDFVARYGNGEFLEIQVKSLRSFGYVFMQKDKFPLSPSRYLVLGLLEDGVEPNLYLIPSERWKEPDELFVNHDYEGKKSKPEWGLNLSQKNFPLLEEWRMVQSVETLIGSLKK